MPDRRRLPDEAKIRRRSRLRREVDEVRRDATGLHRLDSYAKRDPYVAVTTPTPHPTTG
jgi:hypothetical protein